MAGQQGTDHAAHEAEDATAQQSAGGGQIGQNLAQALLLHHQKTAGLGSRQKHQPAGLDDVGHQAQPLGGTAHGRGRLQEVWEGSSNRSRSSYLRRGRVQNAHGLLLACRHLAGSVRLQVSQMLLSAWAPAKRWRHAAKGARPR